MTTCKLVILILESDLIGFAIKPAAVKKATKDSGSRLIPILFPNAKYAISDKETETST